MEIRALRTNDIFKMSKILKKIGVKVDTFSGEINKETGERKKKTQEQLGGEIILQVFENLHLAQNEVNEFLGDLVGMAGKDFGELPLEQSFEIIQQFKNIPGLVNFFKSAGQLTK